LTAFRPHGILCQPNGTTNKNKGQYVYPKRFQQPFTTSQIRTSGLSYQPTHTLICFQAGVISEWDLSTSGEQQRKIEFHFSMSVKMCWKKGLISPERELHSGSSRVKCEIRWRCQKTHKYIIHRIKEHV